MDLSSRRTTSDSQMAMFRRICGVCSIDKIRNVDIGAALGMEDGKVDVIYAETYGLQGSWFLVGISLNQTTDTNSGEI